MMTEDVAGAGLCPGYYDTKKKGENSLGKVWKRKASCSFSWSFSPKITKVVYYQNSQATCPVYLARGQEGKQSSYDNVL